MTDLVKALRARLEFDETANNVRAWQVFGFAEPPLDTSSFDKSREGKMIANYMTEQGRFENARLAPLHEAMLKVVAAAEELCDDWEKFSQDASDECKQLPDIVNRCSLHKRTRNVLAALREIVGK